MTKKKEKKVTVGFISLGCPKNVVDSEKMLGLIAQGGFYITAEPDDADIVIINTCGFIEPAKVESLEVIRNAVECKRRGSVGKVIVAGCLSERLGEGLFKQVDGIDVVMGLGERDNIVKVINKTILAEQPAAYVECAGEKRLAVPDDRARLLITPGHLAYLRISEGCNHRCSFCTIPAIKGRFRSKPEGQVLAEAAELVSAGVVELNVIAQDTSYYGRDLRVKNGLAILIKGLEKIDGLAWIRLMYLYPAGVDEELIETIRESERVVHYLDIPIQHASDRILKAMRRLHTKEQLEGLIGNLRSAMPDIVLRTTMIVGFPGESDDEFGELMDFVKWARFDALGCFKFYPESGTEAAGLPGQVPEKIKQQRLEELMLAQQEIAFGGNRERVGSQLTCLVDSVGGERSGRGRFYGQAPDIDSVCIIKKCSGKPGDFIKTRVAGTEGYDLIVEQI